MQICEIRLLLGCLLTAGFLALTTGALAQTNGDVSSRRDRLRERYSSKRSPTPNISEAIRMLHSEDPDRRLEAVRSLSASSDEQSVGALLIAVADPDLRVRIKAIDGLGNLGTREATGLLVQQLSLRDTIPVEQQRVLAALGKIRDPKSAQPICEFLSRDIDTATRGTAIFALGEIGDRTALGVLGRLAQEKNEAIDSRLAKEAIEKIKDQELPAVELKALDRGRLGGPRAQ